MNWDFLHSILEQISFFKIPQVSFKDLIDISIVAFGIYKIIMWIKDTRTWAVFKGVVIIFMASLVAYLLELHTLSFIISNTITVGTIAIVILFQPELRRALEQLGQGNLWGTSITTDKETHTLNDESISHLVKASIQMAKVKTGALIIIEKDTVLTEYKRTGIAIDSVISSQLLINIFEKNTPLHDGAVIISKNRINAATCFLPLSDSLTINKDLGTRHRAAIGVSEQTDAVVIVVSEETGIVSYVRNGKIRRNLTAEGLEKVLSLDVQRKANKSFNGWKRKGKGKMKNETS
ncbi:diadenylate cyclase CdaA [Candidatus Epulonipiscium viviparus]|uniref:diadenylate cyclase CdaA n=1 Tax=Candidatus Epulonipiscium viviparus TaxID=420336 RepID=UPI00016BFF0D|nr:diadenylate cyclase CdaA [Candidatus Epulopiscium viviparus]